MHEFGIAADLLEAALVVARTHGGQAVERVHVRIGCLRQVAPEALLLAFAALAPGTLAAGATLTWEEVPARIRCRGCGTIFAPTEQWFWYCPACDTPGGEVVAGEELVLERVTLKEA
jgi:hydrogenase nickel incorporation protein HypA/HybF